MRILHRFSLHCLCLGSLLSPLRAETPITPAPTIEERTHQAQERINKWDEEDRRLEKRNNWELPVVIGLFAAGAAFASQNQTYGFAASFAAGTGLVIHFTFSDR